MSCELIKVRVTGGLGNQLFKLANAIRLSQIYGHEITLDLSWYKHGYMRSHLVNSRVYELDYFPRIQFPTFYSKFPDLDFKIGRIQRKLPANFQHIVSVYSESNSATFRKQPRIIDGSFERISYLPDLDTLREYFEFPIIKSKWFESRLCLIDRKASVAIHVRRSDYLKLKNIYDVVPRDYYQQAIQLIKKQDESIEVHLFSDDIKGALDWLAPVVKIDEAVETPPGIRSGEVLRLMSNYPKIVCANSTFSWWAACLGMINQTNDLAILPKKFSNLGNDDPTNFLKFEGWVTL
jgi:hypothetical protein